jgi:WD40 repeat protein
VYPYGQWTITDASLSPDNRFLAYSSIRSIVCLAGTDPADDSEPNLLDFSHLGTGTPRGFHTYFGIWSIRFSGDGREIVAGTGDNSVYVYDIERRQSVLRIPGHEDDVNAVCFGDSQSPHILYSGSDDTTLKVWDRRSMGDGREAGVFLGHTEGLTYVDSKGDGRYVLSNGKDQTAKLWDLRKMMSKEKADRIDPHQYTTRFEYRSNAYDPANFRPHPHDCSLVTFRGHKVLKTLIRCHFSPPGSTDSRYVYSGSYDGSVYIWNLDATLAGKVNVLKATKNSRPRDPELLAETYDYWGRNGGNWMTCVRDASWHPNAPLIAGMSLILTHQHLNTDICQQRPGTAGARRKARVRCTAGTMGWKKTRPSRRSGGESMPSCSMTRGCTEVWRAGGREDSPRGTITTSGRTMIDTIAHGRCLQHNVHLEESWVHRSGSAKAHILVQAVSLLTLYLTLDLFCGWFFYWMLYWLLDVTSAQCAS